MIAEFRVGDRIIANGYMYAGKRGKILRELGNELGIEFDDFIDGHNCDGFGKVGHCRYLSKKDVALLEQPIIVNGVAYV